MEISLSEKIPSLTLEFDSLPQDNIKSLYDKISNNFVINYQFGQNKYPIPKEQENEFLYDDFGIKKNVTLLPISSNGFSYFNFPRGDSTIVFDYVELDKFREFIKDKDYRSKLFSTYPNIYNNSSEKLKINGTIDAPPFILIKMKPFRPYYSVIDLGTSNQFENYVFIGMKYNKETESIKSNLINKKQSIINSINTTTLNIWDKSKILNFVLIAALIMSIILYPVRLCLKLIGWAFKTIKAIE